MANKKEKAPGVGSTEGLRERLPAKVDVKYTYHVASVMQEKKAVRYGYKK